MTLNRSCRAVVLLFPVLGTLTLAAGCDSQRISPTSDAPPEVRRETPAPEPAPEPSPPPAVALKPETPRAAEPAIPPATRPGPPVFPPPEPTPAGPEEKEIPPYVQVLERIRPAEPEEVSVDASSPQRLVIETRNVRRIRIDRERAPLALGTSIVLRLDGQGIEWTADSRTREFERTVNGEWVAARERKP